MSRGINTSSNKNVDQQRTLLSTLTKIMQYGYERQTTNIVQQRTNSNVEMIFFSNTIFDSHSYLAIELEKQKVEQLVRRNEKKAGRYCKKNEKKEKNNSTKPFPSHTYQATVDDIQEFNCSKKIYEPKPSCSSEQTIHKDIRYRYWGKREEF